MFFIVPLVYEIALETSKSWPFIQGVRESFGNFETADTTHQNMWIDADIPYFLFFVIAELFLILA